MLLTRSPLYWGTEVPFLARLACVRHAASVRSEPGSNSPVFTLEMTGPAKALFTVYRAESELSVIYVLGPLKLQSVHNSQIIFET